MDEHRGSIGTSRKPTALSRLFMGPAPVLPGEDSAAYDDLLAQVSGSVKPSNIIEELWLRDYVDLTWEVLRMRRLKDSVIATELPTALRQTLRSINDLKQDQMDTLIRKWRARNPSAMTSVEKRLAASSLTLDAVLARAFSNQIDSIERIDRLITIAEGRRNAVLREIERHRASFSQRLAETLHNVQDVNPKTIETKAIAPDHRNK
jgi:hypothetical protein